MKPLVSVIVPCYNAEKTVGKSLECLVNQTLENMEIIAINDGSSDGTLAVLESFRDRYPERNIRVFSKENEGIAEARNFGLSKVEGTYFGFLDADDETEPGMFAEMAQAAEQTGAELVVSDFIWKSSRGERLQKEGPYETGPDMMVHLFAVLWNKLYRTDFIKSLDLAFPYGDRYEDACFLYRLTMHVKKIHFMNRAYVRYIQNETSITHTNNSQVKNMIDVFRIIVADYRDKGQFDFYRDALEYIHIRFFLGNSFLRSTQIADPEDRRDTILLGWNLLNETFPDWSKNPYLKTIGGNKNRYFRLVRRWNLFLFAAVFRRFLKPTV